MTREYIATLCHMKDEPHLTLLDGTPILIRRLLPQDAALYPGFLKEVTAEDLRLRFFE